MMGISVDRRGRTGLNSYLTGSLGVVSEHRLLSRNSGVLQFDRRHDLSPKKLVRGAQCSRSREDAHLTLSIRSRR